jgi:hypothetical protein
MAAETATLMMRLRAITNLSVFILVPSLENFGLLLLVTLTIGSRLAGAAALTRTPDDCRSAFNR